MSAAVCGHKMRNGKECKMDPDHRGRHSGTVFYCECCGKVRRGSPYRIEEVRLGDGTVDDRFAICFFCSEIDKPWPAWEEHVREVTS